VSSEPFNLLPVPVKMDQRAHLRRNIRLQVTLFSTISCMAMEKRANVIDLILTVL